MQIKVKKLNADAVIPKYAKTGDSGFDLVATKDVSIYAGGTVLVPTGLAFEIPENYELQVRPRSGLSLRTNLRVANSPGTVDSSFRGEVMVIMTNTSSGNFYDSLPIVIKKGEKIAQGVICPIIKAELLEVEELSSTERGDNGFGSTGI